jgi:replicative DNA helicase
MGVEASVCAALVYGSQEAQATILTSLSRDDFQSANARLLFSVSQELLASGMSVNAVSILERKGAPPRTFVDGLDVERLVRDVDVESICKDLRRSSAVHRMTQACKAIANGSSANPEEICAQLEKAMYSASGASKTHDGHEVVSDYLKLFMERLNGNVPPPMSSGITSLDRYIIGLRTKKFYIVAGRPAMGKTALIKSIRAAVMRQGFSCLDFSLEMGAEEHAEREIAEGAQINLMQVCTSKVTQDELTRVVGIPDSIPREKWFIDDSSYSIGAIMQKARIVHRQAAKRGFPLKLITVDYIQLATGDTDDTQSSTAKFSRGLKMLSKELDCAVIGISQLNRNCEHREDKRPLMSDLRESGALEQDADAVMFLYRDVVYNPTADKEEAELIIRKQRGGPTGTVRMKFNARTVTFTSHDTGQSHSSGNDGLVAGGLHDS